MTIAGLIGANLRRKKVRTTFTVLSMLVAFVLFAYLAAIDVAFSLGVDVTGRDRLVTIHGTSLIMPLPIAYEQRLEALPGVEAATHATWFGGKYQDKENEFAVMAVDPEGYLDMYPEIALPEEQRQAWIASRTGAIVGRWTAERLGFEVGQRVPIQGTIYRKADGGDTWEFTIEGIYHGATKGFDESNFFFHYDYLEESRETLEKGLTGWYMVRIADPERAAETAKTIDATFANSFYETKTATEKVFVEGFANQIGNIGLILRWVMLAVFLMILLIAANTMASAVRERTSELAVLKTLGFTDGKVLAMIIAESLLLTVVGGGLGLGLGWLAVEVGGDPTGQFLPVFYVRPRDLAIGCALMAGLGLVSGIAPAVWAMRLRIVDALRRV
jgi:putative ABC transport system permease protein